MHVTDAVCFVFVCVGGDANIDFVHCGTSLECFEHCHESDCCQPLFWRKFFDSVYFKDENCNKFVQRLAMTCPNFFVNI